MDIQDIADPVPGTVVIVKAVAVQALPRDHVQLDAGRAFRKLRIEEP